MFGKIVKGIEGRKFEHILDKYKAKTAGKQDTDLTVDMLKKVVVDFKALYKKELGDEFPDDVHEQMSQAIEAVFASWFGKRAVDYRNYNKIPHDLGTGVNVQTMVFGNMGNDSGTGVAFTRNPATGEKALYGEYLINAQGEDVVAGIRTPKKIAQLQEEMPEVYEQFVAHRQSAGEALSRRAGHGVHRRARQAVDAADPHRQAHGAGRGEDRRRYGQ